MGIWDQGIRYGAQWAAKAAPKVAPAAEKAAESLRGAAGKSWDFLKNGLPPRTGAGFVSPATEKAVVDAVQNGKPFVQPSRWQAAKSLPLADVGALAKEGGIKSLRAGAGALRGGLIFAPAIGALSTALEDPEKAQVGPTAAWDASTPGGRAVNKTANYLSNVGDAATFGQASRVGNWIAGNGYRSSSDLADEALARQRGTPPATPAQQAAVTQVNNDFLNRPVDPQQPPATLRGTTTPAPAATAPAPQDFAAPDGAAVTSKDYTRADGKVDSIRKVVDEQGNTTYTNAKTYGDMQSSFAQGSVVPGLDKEAFERGNQAERELHAAKMAAVHGGDTADYLPGGRKAGGNDSGTSLGGGSGSSPLRWKQELMLRQQQNATTLRGQDLTLQAHRESNAASKNNHEITALRQMAMDQYKMGRDRQEDARNAQADGRANAAAYDARSKANRERIAAAFSTYDATTGKALPNDAIAAEAEAAFANMPQDMASKYKSKNFHDYDADTQNRFVAAHALSRQLASDKSKWGVTAGALPTAHEIFNNANLVQSQPDGSIKIGASNKVSGGAMPWYDLSASDVQRNDAPYVRYLTHGR